MADLSLLSGQEKRQQNNREIRICSCSYMLICFLILACTHPGQREVHLYASAYKFNCTLFCSQISIHQIKHMKDQKTTSEFAFQKLKGFCFNQKKMILAIQFIETFSLGKFLLRHPQVSDDLFNISYQRNTSYLSLF